MGKKNKRRRENRDKSGGITLLVVGLCLILPNMIQSGMHGIAKGGMAMGGLICLGLGVTALVGTFSGSRRLPKKEVMRLAEERKGLITLSEVATGLDIDPDLAQRTLQSLAKAGIAQQRWEEYRKNLWQFPDYMTLPIPESIELAKAKGGKLSLLDLMNSGHSEQTAKETLDALSEKGLAQNDPNAGGRSVIVTTQ